MRTEEVTRLSPLRYEHVTLLGRSNVMLPDELAGGAMRSCWMTDSLKDDLAQIP